MSVCVIVVYKVFKVCVVRENVTNFILLVQGARGGLAAIVFTFCFHCGTRARVCVCLLVAIIL